jgi:hypothetical protein
VCELDVGMAAADMCHRHAILALQLPEQFMRRVRIRRLVDDVGRVSNLRVRGAMDGLLLPTEVHVPVAADSRIRRPLVAGDANETARIVDPTFARKRELSAEPQIDRDMCRLALFTALVATLALTPMASVSGVGCALASAVHGRSAARLAVPMQLAQGTDRENSAALDRTSSHCGASCKPI